MLLSLPTASSEVKDQYLCDAFFISLDLSSAEGFFNVRYLYRAC